MALLLKIQSLEGIERFDRIYSKNPPKVIYVFVRRTKCAINGEFKKFKGSPICYAWFVWKKGYKGNTILKWVNYKKPKQIKTLFG